MADLEASGRLCVSAVMKLPCSLLCSRWFFLLLGAGSLLLLVRLQDAVETVPGRASGQCLHCVHLAAARLELIAGQFHLDTHSSGHVHVKPCETLKIWFALRLNMDSSHFR